MGDWVGIGKIIEVLVPDKKARGFIWILIALLAVAAGGVFGYTAFDTSDTKRIDKRLHPVRIKMYENGALTRHVFEHLENQLPPSQRHSIDDVRREGRRELIDDEKAEKAAGSE